MSSDSESETKTTPTVEKTETEEKPKKKKKASKPRVRPEDKQVGELLPKAAFRRLIKEIAKKEGVDIVIGEKEVGTLQHFFERRFHKYIRGSGLAMGHGKRKTLQPKDLDTASKIIGCMS